MDDPNGVSSSAWAKWSRGWTSEENRHGDLLNRYLYLTGRVDMRAIEVSEKKPMAMSDTQAPPLPRHIQAKGGHSCFYPDRRERLRHGWRCWVLVCVWQVTIQHLITNGFDPKAKKDPYKGLVYTSFQVGRDGGPNQTDAVVQQARHAWHIRSRGHDCDSPLETRCLALCVHRREQPRSRTRTWLTSPTRPVRGDR